MKTLIILFFFIIFFFPKSIAQTKNEINIVSIIDNQITTEVKKFDSFYKAENYHQGYYKLNTEQPYCNAVITPKVSKARKLLEKYY